MRELGELRISVAGLGCNNFGRRLNRKETRAVVDAALDAGINFFDTADVYGRGGSERQLGKALRGRRDRVVVATKFGIGKTGELAEAGGFRDYVRTAVEASLERLGTDWIDLYQYHRPDGVTPIAATLGALDELVGEGKLRAVGCSNLLGGAGSRGGGRGPRGGHRGLREPAEPVQPAGARGRGGGDPGMSPAQRERDRRRHQTGAGALERPSGVLGTERCRPRRARRDLPAGTRLAGLAELRARIAFRSRALAGPARAERPVD